MNAYTSKGIVDTFNRHINYLRVSMTDRCNLSCRYCAPFRPELIKKEKVPTLEELYRLIEIGVSLGITKIRLTGGEPLCRKGTIDFIKRLRDLEGLKDITMTSNGTMVANYAEQLKEAGLSRINISLDTLDSNKFRRITGADLFSDVWEGLSAAVQCGLNPVKINMVVMKGFNDDEIEQMAELSIKFPFHIRFIEYMPIGTDLLSTQTSFMPVSEIEKRVARLGGLKPVASNNTDGPARRYRLEGGQGEIGFIGSMSSHFCSSCNRLRLTAAGYLRPCLLSDEQINLIEPMRRGLSDTEIKKLFILAAAKKKREHRLNFSNSRVLKTSMVSIGG
ncbi:MAG: GTP 3',8-cyclase MoaA [Desulfobacteraceae bacterium]|nr:GTP 3',8-cyclase MoaA [Desulfobacteraceae bacterium]